MIETQIKTPWGRLYVSPTSGICFPNAKHATGVLGSGALAGWAANAERKHIVDTACALFDLVVRKGFPTTPPFRDQLEAAAGKLAMGAARQESMDIGEQANAHILWQMKTTAKMDAGNEPKIEGPATLASMAFSDWAKKERFILHRVDNVFYDEDIGYRADLYALGTLKGKLVAVELQIGKSIYDDKLIRFAAAVKVARHENPDIKEGIVIRVPKTLEDIDKGGSFEVKHLFGNELEQYFTCFTHLLHYWQSIKGYSRCTVEEVKDLNAAAKLEKIAAVG
jgi:hypothetical protein